MEKIEEFLEEYNRLKRYSTPFSIVVFKLVFDNKNQEVNYFNTVLFNLRVFFEKNKRKLDILDRYKSLIIIGLRETPFDKVKGFLQRFYDLLDSYLKNYILEQTNQKNIPKDKITIVNIKLNIYLLAFDKVLDNVIFLNDFNEEIFISNLEQINNLEEKIFEIWKVDFPIVEEG
ncbi:MAG: hypothetical protein ACP5RD_03785 [bacterium]